MKFVDEFRDPAAARRLLTTIEHLAGSGADGGEHFKFMEVCGGHTHTIYRHGIEHLLPEAVELVHGPGCPVCVIPMGRIDDAMWLARQPEVIFTCFGDMMRVPGSTGSLLDAKARGADVRFVYSPLDALKIAKLAVSLGGTETLASCPAAMTHLSVPQERKHALGISDNLVRISVGVENAEDLIADMRQALRAI